MTEADVEIPRTLADLTPRWFESALTAGGLAGAVVADLAVTPVAEGEGFIGVLARLEPTYSSAPPGAPSSVVAKLPTTDPGGVALGMLLRLWEREGRFYTDLAPRLPVRTPRCWYSAGDPDTGAFALLLEDLSALRLGDQVAGLTQPEVTAAVEWLARFHAESWGREPEGLAWMPRVETDPMYQGLQPMLEAVWPVFVDRYGALAPDRVLGWIERLVPGFYGVLTARDLPPAIIHSDYRADNMFFEVGGEGTGDVADVAVIDWQAAAVGQGLYDLAYLLGASVAVDLRREAERDLVERYRRGLETAGVSDLPGTGDFFDLYRKLMLTAASVIALLMGQLDLEVNPRGADLARCIVERALHAAADLRVDEFVPA